MLEFLMTLDKISTSSYLWSKKSKWNALINYSKNLCKQTPGKFEAVHTRRKGIKNRPSLPVLFLTEYMSSINKFNKLQVANLLELQNQLKHMHTFHINNARCKCKFGSKTIKAARFQFAFGPFRVAECERKKLHSCSIRMLLGAKSNSSFSTL